MLGRLLVVLWLFATVAGCLQPTVTMEIRLERPSFDMGSVPSGQVWLANAGPGPARIVKVDSEDFINEVRGPDGRQVFRRPPSIIVVGEYGPEDVVQIEGGQGLSWPLQEVLRGYSFDAAGVWRIQLAYAGGDFETVSGTNWRGLASAEVSVEVMDTIYTRFQDERV